MMDENILKLLEELTLRSSFSDDENNSFPVQDTGTKYLSSGYTSQASNVSSPSHEQLDHGPADEDLDLKRAVSSLFQQLNTSKSGEVDAQVAHGQQAGYDKIKLLVALLGNIDLVKSAITKIHQLVSLGKRMENIYRMYYMDPNVSLDLDEMRQLIRAFSDLYDSETYVREVNVSRVYRAYCKKLMDIYDSRRSHQMGKQIGDEQMIT